MCNAVYCCLYMRFYGMYGVQVYVGYRVCIHIFLPYGTYTRAYKTTYIYA